MSVLLLIGSRRACDDGASVRLPKEVQERNLLSVAYKNVIGARRGSRKVSLSIVETKMR